MPSFVIEGDDAGRALDVFAFFPREDDGRLALRAVIFVVKI